MRNNLYKLGMFILISSITIAIPLAKHSAAGTAEMDGVKIMQKETIGEFLADGNGLSLYYFSRDTKNTSNCTEGCAVNWPPFHADTAKIGAALAPDDFATITRTDGRLQTTYKSKPLYYFKNDKYPGDTFGQGLGGVWFLATP